MKKFAFIASTITALLMPVRALAEDSTLTIKAPPYGYKDLGDFITNVVTISFVVAIVVVLIMLILGAFEWIVSGGDKEAVGKARNRIINALIGLAVLAVAFALAKLGAQILGYPDLGTFTIPGPSILPGTNPTP